MQLFFMIAAVHFLALLSPGPDFFLITKISLASGWRVASGACLGIAVANGVFIIFAFTGVAVLQPDNYWFLGLQITGCFYLFYLGILFIRHAGNSSFSTSVASSRALVAGAGFRLWRQATAMGFLSGILNPKNALFYASLATLLAEPEVDVGWKVFYGLWMFGVVLFWDGLIAVLIGNHIILRRFSQILPWLERISGGMLIMLALVGVLVSISNFF